MPFDKHVISERQNRRLVDVLRGPGSITLASALRSLRFAVIVMAKTMIAAIIGISKIFRLEEPRPFLSGAKIKGLPACRLPITEDTAS